MTSDPFPEADPPEGDFRYRSLFERLSIGLYRMSADGGFLEVNRALVHLLGYPDRATLLATPPASLHAYERERRAWEVTMDQFGVLRDFEFRARRHDGAVIWLRDNAHAVLDRTGTPVRYEGTVEDVTERKRLEDALQISRKLEAVGRLAGGVAHDFNNLLTIIRGNTDVLLADLHGGDLGRTELEEIGQAADRAATLTRQLLAFSRKEVVQPRDLDLNGVLHGMEGLMTRLLPEPINLRLLLDPELGRVLADPAQMEQVVMNLVVNASDAMPGGGRLELETRNVERRAYDALREPPVEPGSYVLLSVRDTGTGMDPETREHAFEPFFTTKRDGTGLGLSTVHGIVAQSGGSIHIGGRDDGGTVFDIYLPRKTFRASPRAPAEPSNTDGAGGETILLAEDERAVRTLVRRVLERGGYTVLEATDGVDGARLAEAHDGRIDLLLTDVTMPKMDGRELGEALREKRPDMAMLFMSGYTRGGREALGANAAFLQKPFSPSALLSAVGASIMRFRPH